jgi:plastin-1
MNVCCSVFLLNLLKSIEPRAVNASIPTEGATDEEKKKNAKYIISVARKIGAQVLLTWEDIVDVKPKMIMTLVASIMHAAQGRESAKAK